MQMRARDVACNVYTKRSVYCANHTCVQSEKLYALHVLDTGYYPTEYSIVSNHLYPDVRAVVSVDLFLLYVCVYYCV